MNTNTEPKIAYMVIIYNKFGVMGMRFADDYKELNAILKEETDKGRKCKVSEREISTATTK